MNTRDPSRTDAEAGPRTNGQLALLCDTREQHRERLQAALALLGYATCAAPGPREALHWLRHHGFAVVLVHQGFAGSGPGDHPVLAAIASLPMKIRRNICVGLCGPDLRSLDPLMAFCHSVNFVINDRDRDEDEDPRKLAAIIQQAVADNDAFYRPFREVLDLAGNRYGRRAYDSP